ncbi:uncharacterized protein LOC133792629 [Humulus lupulus]|uniref:uncharacterized protein LOC133792629 n=1 Tax=Humulus lupulus TaxID=3486 RepID=UPI002B4071B7|nr:uncharacterized protein LOC133792629 [Humulus lupulus]
MASSSATIDDLDARWGEFHIAEEDGQGLILEEDPETVEDDLFDARWCLVGKLLGGRVADFDALKNVLASLWRPVKGMFVKQLEPNRFLFQFCHEIDINRVLEGSPWTFNRSPVILERLKMGDNPRLIPLNTMEIWVQVYNLKAGFMSDRVLKACGGFIGTFISSCPKNYTGVWREFLRVRVRINIEQPLKRRMKIQNSKGEAFWAEFKYERLPTFCFICGILGHSEKFCIRLFETETEHLPKPYGLFMRAPDRRQGKQIGAPWLLENMARPAPTQQEGSTPLMNSDSVQARSRGGRDPQIHATDLVGSGVIARAGNQDERRGLSGESSLMVGAVTMGENRGIARSMGSKGGSNPAGATLEDSEMNMGVESLNARDGGCQNNESFLFLDPKRRRVQMGQSEELEVGRNMDMDLGREDVEMRRFGLGFYLIM